MNHSHNLNNLNTIIDVPLPKTIMNRDYHIHVQANDFGNLAYWNNLLKPYHKVVVITNETIAPLYLDIFIETIKQSTEHQIISIILSDGEQYKNLNTLNDIYSQLLSMNATRKTVLIALGGGVIGDMVGYAAATYMRGIDFIQVPTTLLAQVDSSVGGKTAINHELGKNMIGAFYQPKAVMMNVTTLATLPNREYIAGMAEVIKYALIFDADFWDFLKNNVGDLKLHHLTKSLNLNQPNQAEKKNEINETSEIENKIDLQQSQQYERAIQKLIFIIQKSCEWKAKTVFEDEREQGVRALLNFGHTFGHAIEHALGYGVWLHGEAVGCGMIMASKLSHYLGYITAEQLSEINHTIDAFGLPIIPPQSMTTEQWLDAMGRDKKNHDQNIRFIVLTSIGSAKIVSLSVKQTTDFLETLVNY